MSIFVRDLLSISQNMLGSVYKSGIITTSIKSIVSRSSIRTYMAGTDWPLAGGIHMENGNIILPPQVGPLYSSRKGKCGVVVINNHKLNNSFSRRGYADLLDNLVNYESNEHLGSVVIASSSSSVFSYGSDYRSCFLNSNGKNFSDMVLSMKRKEYDAMNQVHVSDIPVVTIMNGEVVADGAALGFNSRFPVITDQTVLRFPQCKYGFFPDAALSKYLSSLGGYGMYLALTGEKVKGFDLLYLGLARYYIHHTMIEDLITELSMNHSRDSKRIESLIEYSSTPIPPPEEEVIDHYNEISHLFNPCFSSDTSVLDLMDRLKDSEFGQGVLKKMENSTAELQLIWKSIVDASKLSIHGTLKRDYLVVSNMFTKEEGKEFRNRLESRFALKTKYEVSHELKKEAVDIVNCLFEGESPLALEKTNTYDIPLFHGDAMDNDKHFNTVSNEKYDWKRLQKEYLHGEVEEETIKYSERSFVHPVTKLVHPVPYEWEEDIQMNIEEKKRERTNQMEYESEIVLSSVSNTKK